MKTKKKSLLNRKITVLLLAFLITLTGAMPAFALPSEEAEAEFVNTNAEILVNREAADTDEATDTDEAADDLKEAEENANAAADLESEEAGEETSVVSADSISELIKESETADNEPFFTFDVKDDSSLEKIADEELTSELKDIIDEKASTASKKEDAAKSLEESGYYMAEPAGGSKIEVASVYAYQRLMLTAPKQDSIQAYGADKAVYYDGQYLLSYASEEDTKKAYEALSDEFGDDAVIPDIPVKANQIGWGSEYMHLSEEIEKAADGEEVVIAVLDSGIDASHSIFGDAGRIMEGKSFISDEDDLTDESGHGTAVAGIIAESTPSNVKILPIRVLDSKGNGSIANIVYALKYADEKNADIANISLGAAVDKKVLDNSEKQFDRINALIVCAAGNEGKNMDEESYNDFPAEIEKTISVNAIDENGIKSKHSNYGKAIDFSAPGVDVRVASKNGQIGKERGTSFAAPYIASAAALIKSQHYDYSNQQIYDELAAVSFDLGEEGKDVYYGNGCPVFADASATLDDEKESEEADSDNEPEPEPEPEPKVIDFSKNAPSVRGLKTVTYTGKAIKQKITLRVNDKTLKAGSDYSLSYKNNIRPGKASLTIKGKGQYTGSTTYSFTIAKKKNPIEVSTKTAFIKKNQLNYRSRRISVRSLASVKNAKGSLTYSKISGSSKLKINKKTGTVAVKKKLSRGKYTIKVRVNASGNRYYSGGYKDVTLTVRVR